MSVMMSLPGRLRRRVRPEPTRRVQSPGFQLCSEPHRQRESVKGAADIVVANGDFSPAQLLASQKVHGSIRMES